ncbi:MAG: hypothetical protein ACE5ID_09425 [Acidobacteriota bacterium]
MIRIVAGLLMSAASPVLAVTPGEATDLQVTAYDSATGTLSLSYTPACSATNHHIEFGPLQDVSNPGYSGQDCGIGVSGLYTSFNPGPGDFFFLVVGDNGSIEGSYGTALVDGVAQERAPDLLDSACALVQDLSQSCDGPFIPTLLDLTVFRPATETYGAPFQRTAVPDSEEASPGAGIRVNGDDDNGNGLADRDDIGVTGENDLVEMTLSVEPASPPPGFEYVLSRSGPGIRVWNEPTKNTELIPAGASSVLTFSSTTRTVWVEDPSGGTADLSLMVRTTPGGSLVASDLVHFHSLASIIIALGGEGQVPADPPLEPANHGTFALAISLYQLGYDVHMYDEDAVSLTGAGAAFNEVASAIRTRTVENVVIYGYSHGGGSANDLARRLDSNRSSIGTFSIVYTAYMDAIDNRSDLDTSAEKELPPSTQFHDNYYETVCPVVVFFPLCGQSLPGADLNLDINTTTWGAGLDHFQMDDAPQVLQGIRDRLLSLPVVP